MTEWIIASSVLIVSVIVLRYIFKGKVNLKLQYAIWGLVLIRLLVPFNFVDSPISVINAIQGVGKQVENVHSVSRPVNNIQSGNQSVSKGSQVSTYPLTTDTIVSDPVALVQAPTRQIDFVSILPLIYLIGIFSFSLWMLISNMRFAMRLKKSRRTITYSGCPLPVYCSNIVETPCMYGLFKPTIYVTQEAMKDSSTLRHVIEHETTHYLHGDHIWSLLRCVSLLIHWYNPLVWFAAFISRRDGELACDAGTIKRIGEKERTDYGRTLIHMTCQKRSDLFVASTTMTGSKKSLMERIVLIAKKPKMAVYTLVAVLLVVGFVVGCTFTGVKKPADGFSIENEAAGNITEAVVDYAKDYVQDQIDAYEIGWEATGSGNTIKSAKITGITLINTGTAGLNDSIHMYLLEYRLLPEDPDTVLLAGGMSMEDEWITEWSSAGQPYLLIYSESIDEAIVWKPIGVTNTDAIMFDYGTPEMLEAYGDAYTAAAMELYFKYLSVEILKSITVYDRKGITVGIPDFYADQLLIDPVPYDDDATLIRVHHKSTYEHYEGGGWLFSLVRYTEAQYEQFLVSDGSGQSFFAKDDTYYYGFFTATDVQAPDDYEAFSDLLAALEDFVKPDMIQRNGLTAYSDSEFFESAYTYDSEHISINYYPYYASNGSKEMVVTLILSQPVTQGEAGIWCVERWIDDQGLIYPHFPSENGLSALEYYKQQQAASDAGENTQWLDPEQVALSFVWDYFEHSAATLESFDF